MTEDHFNTNVKLKDASIKLCELFEEILIIHKLFLFYFFLIDVLKNIKY